MKIGHDLWKRSDWIVGRGRLEAITGGVTSPAPLFNFFNDFNLFLRPLVADYIAPLLLFLKIFLSLLNTRVYTAFCCWIISLTSSLAPFAQGQEIQA